MIGKKSYTQRKNKKKNQKKVLWKKKRPLYLSIPLLGEGLQKIPMCATIGGFKKKETKKEFNSEYNTREKKKRILYLSWAY